jgi:lipopolysaccharide export system permease protein
VLLAFGVYFLSKATNDARLFESDIYDVYFDKLKTAWKNRRFLKSKEIVSA